MRFGELRDLARFFEREAARTCVRPHQHELSGTYELKNAPSEPCKSLNPFTGMRLVPVANCNNLDFFSVGHDLTA